MKMILAITTILTSFAFSAEARVRVRYAEDYTCATVREVVVTHGEALVYSHSKYAPVDLYDIAYANRCPNMSYDSAPFYVNTADKDNCFIGHRCVQRNHH